MVNKTFPSLSQIISYLEVWSECLIHWSILQVAGVDVGPQHLDEIRAQDDDVLSECGKTKLNGAQQVLQ